MSDTPYKEPKTTRQVDLPVPAENASASHQKQPDDEASESVRSEHEPVMHNTNDTEFGQPYGDLVDLNQNGLILKSIGKDILTDIASDYLNILGTSAAIYEKDGSYALGIFVSGWCKFMDQASRNLCGTVDNLEAMRSGKWHCHESCWRLASLVSIETKRPVDIECLGGLHLYAVPIFAREEVIGSINFGYGNPPTDEQELQELAKRFCVDVEKLKELAASYEPRPAFLIDIAKSRLEKSAKLIGEIVERKLTEVALSESEARLRFVLENSPDNIFIQDSHLRYVWVSRPAYPFTLEDYLGRTDFDLAPHEDAEKLAEIKRRVMREGRRTTQEIALTLKGDERYFAATYEPWRNPDGNIIGLFGYVHDITELKMAEQHKETQLDRERHIADILQGVVFSASETNVQFSEVAARYEPALDEARVGGDFYDIFRIDESRYGILIGDVAGKGLSAARLVTAARYSVKNYTYLGMSSAKTMTLANRALARECVDEAPMVTAFFLILDTDRGEITCVNAGHENMLVMNANGYTEELSVHGLVLGVDPKYEYQEESRHLESGDTLVMVTDGITEARRTPREMFGVEGVKRCVSEIPHSPVGEIADKILESARYFGGSELRDDAAIVVIRFNGR